MEFKDIQYNVSRFILEINKYNFHYGHQKIYYTGIDTLGNIIFLDEYSDVILFTENETIDLLKENNLHDKYMKYININSILDNL